MLLHYQTIMWPNWESYNKRRVIPSRTMKVGSNDTISVIILRTNFVFLVINAFSGAKYHISTMYMILASIFTLRSARITYESIVCRLDYYRPAASYHLTWMHLILVIEILCCDSIPLANTSLFVTQLWCISTSKPGWGWPFICWEYRRYLLLYSKNYTMWFRILLQKLELSN